MLSSINFRPPTRPRAAASTGLARELFRPLPPEPPGPEPVRPVSKEATRIQAGVLAGAAVLGATGGLGALMATGTLGAMIAVGLATVPVGLATATAGLVTERASGRTQFLAIGATLLGGVVAAGFMGAFGGWVLTEAVCGCATGALAGALAGAMVDDRLREKELARYQVEQKRHLAEVDKFQQRLAAYQLELRDYESRQPPDGGNSIHESSGSITLNGVTLKKSGRVQMA